MFNMCRILLKNGGVAVFGTSCLLGAPPGYGVRCGRAWVRCGGAWVGCKRGTGTVRRGMGRVQKGHGYGAEGHG